MIKLRLVSDEDCRLIWQWANDPDVRVVSFSEDSITYENHVKWFETKLNNPNCYFYIAVNREHAPIGQVRFDLKGNQATISISLSRKFRGQGYGSKIIELGSQKIFEVSNVDVIHAYVKKENVISLKVFQKAGFMVFDDDTTIDEQQAFHIIREKKSDNE
jgi:RimJ/RimL family protein N-acetyltransferase